MMILMTMIIISWDERFQRSRATTVRTAEVAYPFQYIITTLSCYVIESFTQHGSMSINIKCYYFPLFFVFIIIIIIIIILMPSVVKVPEG